MKGSLGTIAGRCVSVRMVLPVTLSLESAPALLAGTGPTVTGVSIHCTHTHIRDSPSICDTTSLLRGQGARHPWSVSCLLSAPPAACDQGFYGQGCSEVCVCETGYCNPMNGTCTCEPSYFGADCAHSESRRAHITHTHTRTSTLCTTRMHMRVHTYVHRHSLLNVDIYTYACKHNLPVVGHASCRLFGCR